LHGGDAGQVTDHAGGGLGEFGGAAGEGLAVLDREQVSAQLGDFGEQPGLGGRRQAEHGDDGGHPDRDAQRGQPRPQFAGPQAYGGEAGQVG